MRLSIAVFTASLWLATFLVPGPVIAADQPPVLVITATRMAQPSSDVVVPTRVITHREIEASGATTASGVLKFYPGFDVSQSGGPGQLTSVFVQGTNSNMVKVLINGVPVNDSTTGGAPWADIPAEDIERIEIVQGPLSTLWGSSAMGGVINIITRHAGGDGGHLDVSGGGWDTRAGSLGLHASGQHLSAGATVNEKHTGGVPPVEGMSEAAPYDNRTVTAYADLHTQAADLHAGIWQSSGRGSYPTGGPPYSPLSLLSQQYWHQTASLRLEIPLTGQWHFRGGLLQTRNVINQDQPDSYATPPQAHDFARSLENRLFAQLAYSSGAMQLLLGASHAHTHAVSLVFGQAYDQIRRTSGGYLEWQVHGRSWHLSTAVRRTEDSQYGGFNTWNIGVGYHLAPSLVMNLSAGTGYQAPTFNDLYSFYGNPNLKPEVSHGLQAGLQMGLGHAGKLHVLAFQQRIDDLIVYDGALNENDNIQHARIRGVTTGWSWQHAGLVLALDATWQDPVNLTSGQLLVRQSSRSYDLRMAYGVGRWQLGSDWVYQGRQSGILGQSLAPYVLGNLTLRIHLDRQWMLHASVSNLLNSNYIPAYYDTGIAYLAPSRRAMVGVRYDFGTFS